MISLLLPTRKRPHNILRLLQSLNETTSVKSDVEVVLRFDEDDDATISKLPEMAKLWENFTCAQMTKPKNYGILWQEASTVARGDILMICADDLVFRSKNWDDVVRFAFRTNPDNIALVFGRDGHHDRNGATHPFIHRKWVETVGYLGAGQDYDKFLDMWLDDISKMINRRVFFPDIYTEHMHHAYNKAQMDEVYRERVVDDNEYAAIMEKFEATKSQRQKEAQLLLNEMK